MNHCTRKHRGRACKIVAIGSLLIMLLAGCSSDREESGSAGNAVEGGASNGSARVDSVDPTKVIATQTVKVPTSPGDSVDIGLESLKVEDSLTTLRLIYTPRFTSVTNTAAISLFGANDQHTFRPYLLDRTNLKRYDVVKVDLQPMSSDDVNTKTTNGNPMVVYAVFAAPEDAATTFDVMVTDYWPAFKDVVVTK